MTIEEAEARAHAAVQLGIIELRRAVARAHEYEEEYGADGRTRRVAPKRAVLAGALRRTEEAFFRDMAPEDIPAELIVEPLAAMFHRLMR